MRTGYSIGLDESSIEQIAETHAICEEYGIPYSHICEIIICDYDSHCDYRGRSSEYEQYVWGVVTTDGTRVYTA